MNNIIYLIKINFYASKDFKLNKIARSYKQISQEVDIIDDFNFVCYTDGNRYKLTRNIFEEIFDFMENICYAGDFGNVFITELLDGRIYMSNKIFKYRVNLVPLEVENKEQNDFRNDLLNIPYLLYKVEQLTTGEIIAINKPGGKRNFGRLSRDDFMVFIYNPGEESLWLISHNEISDDIAEKYEYDKQSAISLIEALYYVCCGDEPDYVLNKMKLNNTVGISVETILKVYKWIWGQEDCNYPTKAGRWYSMYSILERFGISVDDFMKRRINKITK